MDTSRKNMRRARGAVIDEQYSRDAYDESRGCGGLDRPVKPDDDSLSWWKPPSLRGALLSAEARLRAKADATKQSILSLRGAMDCFAYARNDGRAIEPAV
jgi:hypothetical protein